MCVSSGNCIAVNPFNKKGALRYSSNGGNYMEKLFCSWKLVLSNSISVFLVSVEVFVEINMMHYFQDILDKPFIISWVFVFILFQMICFFFCLPKVFAAFSTAVYTSKHLLKFTMSAQNVYEFWENGKIPLKINNWCYSKVKEHWIKTTKMKILSKQFKNIMKNISKNIFNFSIFFF